VLQEVPEPVEGQVKLGLEVVLNTAAVGEAAGDMQQVHKLAAVLFMVQAGEAGEAIIIRLALLAVLLVQQ
jgi:hypothetical protein